MPYCHNCGKPLKREAIYCQSCGTPISKSNVSPSSPSWQDVAPPFQSTKSSVSQNTYHPLLYSLSQRIKVQAILWTIIGSLQIIGGFLNIFLGISLNSNYGDGTGNIISGVIFIIVGIINLISSTKDFRYSKEILIKPFGIIKTFQPLNGIIRSLCYNFLFGGIIGVLGSIYALILRNFVLKNADYFQSLELKEGD